MMGKKKKGVCPYLETSHSRAILHYLCQAVGGKGLKIRTGDISNYPCFTTGDRNCKNYKKRQEVR